MNRIIEELAQSLIEGKKDRVEALTKQAMDSGVSIDEILNKGLIGGMDVVGERFKQADMFIPEVMLSAQAMKAGMALVMPLLKSAGFRAQGKVILGTVKGDIHEIGKNLVGVMLNGAGFEVIDVGVDVPAKKFVEAATEQGAQIIAMSALLTVTMPAMRDTVEELKKAGLRSRVKTLIGGATVTQRYADEIGADGYARDAASAVLKARELVKVE